MSESSSPARCEISPDVERKASEYLSRLYTLERADESVAFGAWLRRQAEEALKHGVPGDTNRPKEVEALHHHGLRFRFAKAPAANNARTLLSAKPAHGNAYPHRFNEARDAASSKAAKEIAASDRAATAAAASPSATTARKEGS